MTAQDRPEGEGGVDVRKTKPHRPRCRSIQCAPCYPELAPASTPAAGTGDGTEVIEAVLLQHRTFPTQIHSREGWGECECGTRLGPLAFDRDGYADYDEERRLWAAHVAAAIRAALTPPEDQP